MEWECKYEEMYKLASSEMRLQWVVGFWNYSWNEFKKKKKKFGNTGVDDTENKRFMFLEGTCMFDLGNMQ